MEGAPEAQDPTTRCPVCGALMLFPDGAESPGAEAASDEPPPSESPVDDTAGARLSQALDAETQQQLSALRVSHAAISERQASAARCAAREAAGVSVARAGGGPGH